MRAFTLIFCFIWTSMTLGQTNSVLSEGSWFKFSIDTTGVFKIDRNFLQQLGVNPSSINPKHLKIFGNGGKMLPQKVSDPRFNDLQENAIYVRGENDGSFDAEDFILFYGIGPHGWNVNPVNGTANHQQNIYGDASFYFLHLGNIDSMNEKTFFFFATGKKNPALRWN